MICPEICIIFIFVGVFPKLVCYFGGSASVISPPVWILMSRKIIIANITKVNPPIVVVNRILFI